MFVHFLYSCDFYFTGTRESPSVDLLLLIRLILLHSTTGAFLSLQSSDAEKKRPPRLGIFCLIRQKPLCQLRVATYVFLRVVLT